MHADHPRACGANFRPVSRGCSRFGSSPRVRGKRCKLRQLKQQIRIIPARAGQTNIESTLRYRRTDHPRACGANDHPTCGKVSENGSSPRVRGKPDASSRNGRSVRIIPARAGQTRSRSCPPRTRRRIIPARAGQTCQLLHHERLPPDHPRACGANMPILCKRETVNKDHPRACGANVRGARYAVLRDGSSPRVRGKPGGDPPVGHQLRIIPARAGQTPACSHCRRTFPDHPRACGANLLLNSVSSRLFGSSPRVRGKPTVCVPPTRTVRIIPARAGQTQTAFQNMEKGSDHPRACGANPMLLSSMPYQSGSSPRVRGKLDPAHVYALDRRIIPARAGQTGDTASPRRSSTDHPRACGANLSKGSQITGHSGSSPRVRGKLPGIPGIALVARIIPARAGQTGRNSRPSL